MVLGVVAVALLMPVLASAAPATPWSAPETLSAGEDAQSQQVAMSADGTTQTVTWIQSLNPGWSEPAWVHVTTSTDFGATWSTVQILSEVGKGVDDRPQLVMSADGTTQTITWSRSNGANDQVQVTTSTDSGATWSPAETLSEAGQDAFDPQIAISTDGTTQTVTWRRSNGANHLIQARTSTDSGATWSPAENVS